MKKYELGEKDYLLGMKYADIAEKYDVTINTVKSWKRRYGWKRKPEDIIAPVDEKGCIQKKAFQINKKEKEKLKELQEDFSDRQKLFCMYYMQNFNATSAAKRAGYSMATSYSRGHTLLKNPKIRAYLDELQDLYREKLFLDKDRILSRYAKIAFSDMSDYIDEEGKFIGKGNMDGTLIKKIKLISKEEDNGSKGCKKISEVAIELEDRSKALEALGRHLGIDKVETGNDEKIGLLDEMLEGDYGD